MFAVEFVVQSRGVLNFKLMLPLIVLWFRLEAMLAEIFLRRRVRLNPCLKPFCFGVYVQEQKVSVQERDRFHQIARRLTKGLQDTIDQSSRWCSSHLLFLFS